MALLTISTALNPVKFSLMSDAVPAIVGFHGIGKSQLAMQIAESLGWAYFHIDVNLLKEGEIGGLPVTSEMGRAAEELPEFLTKVVKAASKQEANEDNYNKVVGTLKNKLSEIKKDNSKRVVTKYATYHTLAAIEEYCNANPEAHVLLFLDEFNRAENVVMQEAMNLILNREINGWEMPANVHLLLGMNPSKDFEEFKDKADIDYMVTDMDKAQLDRFRLFFIDADLSTWVNWAMEPIETGDGKFKSRIHQDIVEFITVNPECLNQPDSNDDITPSSRSWERLNKTYELLQTTKYTQSDLYNICRGDLGRTVATQFTQFLADNRDPIIKPQEIFIPNEKKQNINGKNVTTYKPLNEEQIKRIRSGNTYPRMMMIVKNCVRYVIEHKNNKYMAERLVDVITLLPRDLMTMVMTSLYKEHRSTHNALCNWPKYIEEYEALERLVR